MAEDRAARLQRLYSLSAAADNAYQAELEHEYGAAQAADARYDYDRNQATDMLVLLRQAKRNADAARRMASEENA